MNLKFRRPDYIWHIPSRQILMQMSKSDLAELVFDYAVRVRGESDANEGNNILDATNYW